MTRSRVVTLGSALVVAAFGATGTAYAGVFTVDEGVVEGDTFQADNISGRYNELLTLEGSSFEAAAYWNATSFGFEGDSVQDSLVGSNPNINYGLYGIFNSSGEFDPGTGTFTGDSGDIEIWLDPSLDNEFNLIGSNNGPSVSVNDPSNDDVLLGSATNLRDASGSFDPEAGEGDQGSFALNFDDFALTGPGSEFFTDPEIFYEILRVTGQFDFSQPFDFGGENVEAFVRTSESFGVRGSADGSFRDGEVPVPGVLSLFGLGLLGLGVAARRRTVSA